MGMRGNNFFNMIKHGLALETSSVASGVSITGPAIAEPWKTGRQLVFMLVGGDQAVSTTATCVVQGLLRSDGTTWQTLKESDGTTNLAFTPSKLADAGDIEDGTLLGTIDVSTIDSTTYKSVRLLYTRGAVAGVSLVGAAYMIYDLYRLPEVDASDDLFGKTYP